MLDTLTVTTLVAGFLPYQIAKFRSEKQFKLIITAFFWGLVIKRANKTLAWQLKIPFLTYLKSKTSK